MEWNISGISLPDGTQRADVLVKPQGQSYRLSLPLTLMPVIVALQRAKAEISWPLDYDFHTRQHCHLMAVDSLN